MATIDDLNKSISEMAEQELIDRMLEIRRARRTYKVKAKKKTTAPKKSVDMKAAAEKLSPEARAKLIAELEAME